MSLFMPHDERHEMAELIAYKGTNRDLARRIETALLQVEALGFESGFNAASEADERALKYYADFYDGDPREPVYPEAGESKAPEAEK